VTVEGGLEDWAAWGKGAFSGTATYRTEFTVDRASQGRYFLDLGDVRECAEVRINGKAAGHLLWEPYRLEITALVKDGANALEVDVCNTMANAFHASRDDGRSAEAGPPSGLLGPVRVIFEI
jgi:hypothetical protein